MDRTEPRVEPDLRGLTFRRRAPRWPEPETESRFSIVIAIFLLVVLVYPWYSYWVQSHLLARDLRQGVQDFTAAMQHESAELDSQFAQHSQASAEEAERQRIASVRVLGISDGILPLAVVDLGQSNMWEADASICRQAGLWLHRSVAGTVIRVQRARGTGTRAPIQQLACP